jgi:hypothetical protein
MVKLFGHLTHTSDPLGGNIQEAMSIGRDIRRLLMETEGPVLDYYPDRSARYSGGDYPLCIENGFPDGTISAKSAASSLPPGPARAPSYTEDVT